MPVEIVDEHLVRDEVVHWVYDDFGYHAFTSSGMTLNIIHSVSVQLPIERPEDYFTYLWLETLQGFYMARQRIVESAPQGWWLVRQLIPGNTYNFFQEFQDNIEDYLERLDARLAMEDAAYEPLEGRATSPAPMPPGTFTD